MKLDISYATMSYLRDLVRKEQNKHFTDLFGIRINVPPNKMQEEFDRFYKFHDMTPQISKEGCMVAILKECDINFMDTFRIEFKLKKE